MPAFHKDVLDSVLPPPSEQPWTPERTAQFIRERGTRSAALLTTGLLMRSGGADTENARLIIRDLLTLQQDAPGEKDHGLWMTSNDPARDRNDQNWREFVGTGLLVARDRYPEQLGAALVADIDRALRLAAEGSAARDVDAHYSNIALMSASLLDYVGRTQNLPDLAEAGYAKASGIHELFSRHRTFTEYNSPTYYGVNLMALSVWRAVAESDSLREWGASMEAALWEDIGAFYHASLRNFCGPHVRAKGMDASRYTAITGVCIGMATNDGSLAPLPPDRSRWQMYEIAYAAVLAELGLTVPDDVVPHLRSFQGPRTLSRTVPWRQFTFDVSAVLREDWMMGAATGMRRRWDQHYPGTLHWRTAQGGLGWLLVSGENAAECTIDGTTMTVRTVDPNPDHPIRIEIDGVDASAINGDTWALNGLRVKVASPLGDPVVETVESRRQGEVLQVSWPVPEGWDASEAVLQIAVLD